MAVDHQTTIHEVGEGGVFGADKTTGVMDPLQQATDAGDLHQWEMSLR